MRPATLLVLFLAASALLPSLAVAVAATRSLNQAPTMEMKIQMTVNIKGATCTAVRAKVKSLANALIKDYLNYFPDFTLKGPTCSIKQGTAVVKITAVAPVPEGSESLVDKYREVFAGSKTLLEWSKDPLVKAFVSWAAKQDFKVTRLSVILLD